MGKLWFTLISERTTRNGAWLLHAVKAMWSSELFRDALEQMERPSPMIWKASGSRSGRDIATWSAPPSDAAIMSVLPRLAEVELFSGPYTDGMTAGVDGMMSVYDARAVCVVVFDPPAARPGVDVAHVQHFYALFHHLAALMLPVGGHGAHRLSNEPYCMVNGYNVRFPPPGVVQGYSWLMVLPPDVVHTLGGWQQVSVEAPVASIDRVEYGEELYGATVLLCRDPAVLDDPERGQDLLRRWRDYLAPVLRPRASANSWLRNLRLLDKPIQSLPLVWEDWAVDWGPADLTSLPRDSTIKTEPALTADRAADEEALGAAIRAALGVDAVVFEPMQSDAAGRSLFVSTPDPEQSLAVIRPLLPDGYVVAATTGLQGSGIVAVRGASPGDVLRAVGTEGSDVGLDTETLARHLDRVHDELGVELIDVQNDGFRARLLQSPSDPDDFARDFVESFRLEASIGEARLADVIADALRCGDLTIGGWWD